MFLEYNYQTRYTKYENKNYEQKSQWSCKVKQQRIIEYKHVISLNFIRPQITGTNSELPQILLSDGAGKGCRWRSCCHVHGRVHDCTSVQPHGVHTLPGGEHDPHFPTMKFIDRRNIHPTG